jgi:hypothetical protein
MPEGGVIFSDGVFDTALEFEAGTDATFSIAEDKINFVL